MLNSSQVRETCWNQDKKTLQSIRRAVFIEEQDIPEELEWDKEDLSAFHFLFYNAQKEAVACTRLLRQGQIRRMAVLRQYRHQGIGSKLLNAVIEFAEENNIPPLFLYAQNHAIPFYQKHGFRVSGKEFIDANIPHHKMKHLSFKHSQ